MRHTGFLQPYFCSLFWSEVGQYPKTQSSSSSSGQIIFAGIRALGVAAARQKVKITKVEDVMMRMTTAKIMAKIMAMTERVAVAAPAMGAPKEGL